jgi:hypothetical protein
MMGGERETRMNCGIIVRRKNKAKNVLSNERNERRKEPIGKDKKIECKSENGQ